MPGPAPGGHYEFNQHQNASIAKCAGRIRVWGIVAIIVGSLFLLVAAGLFVALASQREGGSALVGAILLGSIGAANLGAGIYYIGAGKAMQQVVDTQGNDIHNMMEAFKKLSTAFMAEVALTILPILAGIVSATMGGL